MAAKTIPVCEVTVGHRSGDNWPYAETCAGVEKAGAKCVEKDVTISFYYNIEDCFLNIVVWVLENLVFIILMFSLTLLNVLIRCLGEFDIPLMTQLSNSLFYGGCFWELWNLVAIRVL